MGQELLRGADGSCGLGLDRTWFTPLNLDSNYAREARSVAQAGSDLLKDKAKKKKNKAIVLDVDDTTLTTWDYELFSNWDFNPATNANFVGLTGTAFTGNMFPATPGMVDMVNLAKALGYKIFFLTGRGDAQHDATLANLINDSAGHFADITPSCIPDTPSRRSTPATRCPRRSTSGTAALPTACSPSRRWARIPHI